MKPDHSQFRLSRQPGARIRPLGRAGPAGPDNARLTRAGGEEQTTAYGALPREAFAEQADAVAAIERALAAFTAYEKINYLMLMMVDPNPHFHVIPRYSGTRVWRNVEFPDAGWPKAPQLGSGVMLSAKQIAAMAAELTSNFGNYPLSNDCLIDCARSGGGAFLRPGEVIWRVGVSKAPAPGVSLRDTLVAAGLEPPLADVLAAIPHKVVQVEPRRPFREHGAMRDEVMFVRSGILAKYKTDGSGDGRSSPCASPAKASSRARASRATASRRSSRAR